MARIAVHAGLLPLCAHVAAAAVLLQQQQSRHMTTVAEEVANGSSAQGPQACAELANKGTYFTVDVEVGTPGQSFSVVADTGSDTLIIPSCICQESGYCSRRDRCFLGTNRSSSFNLVMDGGEPRGMLISFGSGTVKGVIAQEIAHIGGLEVNMSKGIMLMTSKVLDFDSSFEGILGLGIPKEDKPVDHTDHKSPHRVIDARNAGSVEQILKWLRGIFGGLQIPNVANVGHAVSAAAAGRPAAAREPPGLLEQAGIGRFAICFNDGSNGVLRLGVPEAPNMDWHASVGVVHWGLGFHGISVAGDKMVHMDFCDPKDMRKHQQTPCGVIPDSGTTMITGPRDQLSVLLGSLCDNWPRCRRNHTAMVKAAKSAEAAAAEKFGFNPFDLEPWTKVKIMEALLEDCEDWLNESVGLNELPELRFHVVGGAGKEQILAMPGHAYVIETTYELKENLTEKIKGNRSSELENITDAWLKYTGGRMKVCSPAFSVMDYETARNGPIWILGSPLFYEYNVGYDLFSKPPAISFQSVKEAPCGSCDKKLGLVSSDADLVARAASANAAQLRRPRWLGGPARGPSFDLGRPL